VVALRQVIRVLTATLAVTRAVPRRREERLQLMIPASRRHRQRPAIPITAKDSVVGNGTGLPGFWSLPPAQNSARVIPLHHSPERRMVRFSRFVAHLLKAVVRSSATNGICQSLVSACVSPRFISRCTWSRLGPVAGSGRIYSTAVTSLS
jgi:hypothetical protein